jgi:hypothetical protein
MRRRSRRNEADRQERTKRDDDPSYLIPGESRPVDALWPSRRKHLELPTPGVARIAFTPRTQRLLE